MKSPFVVLGEYKLPIVKEPSVVGSELVALTAKLGFKPTMGAAVAWIGADWRHEKAKAEVRGPNVFYARSRNKGDWHWDGPMDKEWECGLIVWSSKSPTQLRYEDKIYTPEPSQIVLFRNRGPQHRQHGSTKGRWFYRQYVALSASLERELA